MHYIYPISNQIPKYFRLNGIVFNTYYGAMMNSFNLKMTNCDIFYHLL